MTAALLFVPLALAIGVPPPTIAPARTTTQPLVDGSLDDAVWATAPVFDAFVQKFPDEGATPTGRTTLRVLYDDLAVFVAIDCEQPDAVPVARLTRRDRISESDRVTVDLDTTLDRKSAFHFEVNAAGVLVDGLRFDDTDISYDWDEHWEARVAHRPGGWSAELRLPLRALHFRAQPSQMWGVQVRRFVAARQEIDELAYVPRDVGGEVSRFGLLGPFEQLHRPISLELQPFVLGRIHHEDPSDASLARGFGADGALGVDGRWLLGEDLALDFTVLPDFGQVEADQVVLNLSSYEIFFPEKRPFFLERLDLFATPVTVLYTRRVGALPDPPELGAGEALVAPVTPASIWSAAKLTGRVGSATTLGVLSAFTGESNAEVRRADGHVEAVRVAPPTLYSVGRLRTDLTDGAALGLIGMATVRFADATARDSFVGGADLAWRSPAGAWSLLAQALASTIRGGATRTFPDGTRVGAGDTSAAGYLRLLKEGGEAVGELQCDADGRRFDPGDLGFAERQNLVHCFGSLGWHDTHAGRLFLEQQSNLELFYRANLDGQSLASGVQLNTSGQLRGFSHLFAELHYRPAHFDDREFGDGTALERAGLVGLELHVTGDPRALLGYELSSTTQWLTDGLNLEADGRLSLKVWPQLDLELLPQALYTFGEPRWIGDDASGTRRFGRQRALGVGATLRSTWTFTPELSLQAYAQVFAASVRYQDFQAAPATDLVVTLDQLVPAGAPAKSPDSVEGTLNTSVVLRWEWRLGSTLYVVYSHAQANAGALVPGDGAAGLPVRSTLHAPAADTLLVKLSMWIG
jgi:hypothetical protein